MTSELTVKVSPGELVDRISISELRVSRLTDPDKVVKVHAECMELRRTWEDSGIPYGHLGPEIMRLWRELHDINLKGWGLEDRVRAMESIGDYGTVYIESCRAIHRNNDQRSATKRAINDLVGSEAVEEKIHGGAS